MSDYVRLSSYYFVYFAIVGTIIPYLGLYLSSLQFSAVDIGHIISMMALARVLSPIVWDVVARYANWHLKQSVFFASFFSAVLVFGFWLFDDYQSLLWLSWWLGFFWHAALPHFEAITLRLLAKSNRDYAQVRLWGSLGFVFGVQFVGLAMDFWGVLSFLVAISILFVLLVYTIFLTPRVTECVEPDTVRALSLWQVLNVKGMTLLMMIGMFMQISHGVYYAFFSISLSHEGYANTWIGFLWSLGVVAEVVMFLLMYRLLPKLTMETWLMLALVVAAVRWLMVALTVDQLWVLVLVQLLHAVTFALFHSALMHLLNQLFPQDGASQAQSLYASLGYGIGGIVGAISAGYLWSVGGTQAVFVFASVAAMIGGVIAFVYRQRSLRD